MKISLSSELTSLASRVSGAGGSLRPALAAGAAAVARAVGDFYRAKPSRSGFWSRMVSGSAIQVTSLSDTAAVITLDSYEIAHRIKGGTVRPIAPRKFLAIPLNDEARAAGYPSNNRIPDLFVPKGTRVLAAPNPDGTFRALWALVASVTHRPDPSSAVPDALLAAAAEPAMRDAILRALKK